jgi:hypothetical protein
VLELHLLLNLLVTFLAVPFSERVFRARTVKLGAASHTPDRWGGYWFAAYGTINHVITKKIYVKLSDKA